MSPMTKEKRGKVGKPLNPKIGDTYYVRLHRRPDNNRHDIRTRYTLLCFLCFIFLKEPLKLQVQGL